MVIACKGDCDDNDPDEYGGAPELCDGRDNDCDTELPEDEQDLDGDGEMACAGDCDDGDATRWSTALEECNGLDEDCSGAPDAYEVDADDDGFLACAECDDDAAATYPGADETPYDGIDQDCDGGDLVDVDGDGFAGNLEEDDPLLDCDDEDDDIHPGAPDPPFDGLDTNCDLADGVDADGDGWPYLAASGEEWQTLLLDCDDTDPALNLDDADGDASTTCGGDCDDTDPLVEALDADSDGVSTCSGDCDDAQELALPGGFEICDGIDNDCSGAPEADEVDEDGDGDLACSDCDDDDDSVETFDQDGDGRTTCAGDCDDFNPTIYLGAPDPAEDGSDQNCDLVDGVDADGDGWAAVVHDCDDTDPALNLDDGDEDGSTTCSGDCDDEDAAVEALDQDGDGISTCGPDGVAGTGDEDCDDLEESAYPGGTEVCDGLDNDCVDGPEADEVDADEDGWLACAECDDDAQENWPGNVEACDGLDNDCDPETFADVSGEVDGDADGDLSCSDCDDDESTVWTGAPELCDGLDNDCNGSPDVDAAGEVDADADTSLSCEDCDDDDDANFPANTEACDGEDNDCNGVSDADPDGEVDDDGDGALSCDDCADDDPAQYPGNAELCDGLDQDCDGEIDDDGDGDGWSPCVTFDPALTWSADSDRSDTQFGREVGWAGDVNADGYDDVVVGGERYGSGHINEGRAWVYLGSATGLEATAAWSWESNLPNTMFGSAVAGAGDVNGDGFDDLVIGALGYDTGGLNQGRAYVFLGASWGVQTSPAWTAESGVPHSQMGSSVAGADDINADGFADIIVGAPQAGQGKAFVFHGSLAGPSAVADATLLGEQDSGEFGYSVAGVGDVNGDGFDDVMVGARLEEAPDSNEGRAHLFLGSAAGVDAAPTWTGEGDQAGCVFGSAVTGLGDLDSDGFSDFGVGAPGYDDLVGDAGMVAVYFGAAGGPSLAPDISLSGSWSGANFGAAISGGHDVDGDGLLDLLVGAEGFGDGQAGEGAIFLYLGTETGPEETPAWMAESGQAGAALGFSVVLARDTDGDGFDEIVGGAPYFDDPESTEGAVFLYAGEPTPDCDDSDASLYPGNGCP